MRTGRQGRYALGVVGFAALLLAAPAHATHFRYGTISWSPVSGNIVEFTIQAGWRRDNNPSFNPCINVLTNTTKPCTGADTFPAVGDVIREDIGTTRFDFGDGSSTLGSPSGSLYFVVTAIDPTNNWLTGFALDPTSLPAIDTTIRHTYANSGPFTARIDSCCRIAANVGANAHINNPEGNYRVETTVRPGTGDRSPVTSMPPIVNCTQNSICTFPVPATDADGNTLNYRFSTPTEAGSGFTQPGPTDAPNAATITTTNPSPGVYTGQYTWNTTGAAVVAGKNTLYSTQVTIEEKNAGGVVIGKIAVDFFIQLVANTGVPPVFTQPVCGSTLPVTTGQLITFGVSASDPDIPTQSVTLNVAGLPSGATMTPGLPTSGNPVSSTFNWTPQLGDAGPHVINFSATDSTLKQATCSVTVNVISSCGDGIVQPGAGEQCDGGQCCTAGCLFVGNGTTCSDGNACTQTDTCQTGVCTGGNTVVCATPDQCHNPGTCDTGTGICSNPIKPNGSSCNDGSACTQTDTCQAGVCTGGNPVTCTALDQCHDVGTCNPGTGVCSNPNKTNGTTCADGNACTQTDTCQSGTCTGSNPVTCTPLDQCHTAGTCNPGTGLCSNPNQTNGTTCNDGNACTQTDTCQSGSCTGTNPVTCTASDQCHDAGVCDPSNGSCSNPAKPNGSTCTDGNACTQSDTCQSGTCTGANPVTCTPLDQCHNAGVCNTGTGICSNPTKPNGTTCADGNACTQTDTCQSGTCTGTNPVVCSALDDCHEVGTCDPGSGVCSNPNVPDGTACNNDGSLCTQTDTCQSGTCTGSNPVICAPIDQCHDAGVCNPGTGTCSTPAKPNGTTCDDGNACSQTDTCQAGMCSGGNPVICTASDQCHDVGSCDPDTGFCSNPNKSNGTTCDDGNECSQTDSCQAGVCTGTNPVVCTALDQCHNAGVCNTGTGTCSNPAKPNGTGCNDGSFCTQTDTCQAGTCTGGNPVICTASDQCHSVGSCDPDTGVCSDPTKPNGTTCSDGNACTQTDTCQAGACSGTNPVVCTPLDQCHNAGVCNTGTGTCSNPTKPNGTTCVDGNACTQTDTCQAGTCTGTNPVTCPTLNQCHDPSVCDPGTGTCSNVSKPDGSPCSDGDGCTQTDSCQGGSCAGTNPVSCTALDVCHDPGVCDPGTGNCSNPPKPDGATCGAGTACDGAAICAAGVCEPGPDGDADDDGICDTADDCILNPDPDQSDIDGDGIGDVCDDEDGGMNLLATKTKGTAAVPRPNGGLSARGEFVTDPPPDTFTSAGGIAIKFVDSMPPDLGTPLSFVFPFLPTECSVTAATGRVRCASADGSAKATFKPIKTVPVIIRFNVKLTRKAVVAPFKGPFRVTVSYGASIDHRGEIEECKSAGRAVTCHKL